MIGRFDLVGEALDAAASQYGDREAYVEPDGDRVSFAGWADRSSALAADLHARGVRRGDVVALLLPSSIDFAVCYAAVARLGAITTAINTRYGAHEITSLLQRAAPVLVVDDPDSGLSSPLAGVPVLHRGDLRAGRAVAMPPAAALSPDDPVVIIWTSGTTGAPKGAVFDHRNLSAVAVAAGAMSAPYDRRLVATPFSHAGYLAKLWDQALWGTTVVISPVPWSASVMLRLLVEERVTVAGGVPAQWALLLREPELPQLPDLRVGVVASAPVTPDLVASVAEAIGVPLVVRYAMTESPTIAGTEPDDPFEVRCGTVGRAQKGMQFRVVDGDGGPCAMGQIGVVQVRGDCVMRGYWNAPTDIEPDGWLRTQDLGHVDATGALVLAGRSGDVYLRGGFNVHPVQVESVLAEHPQVRAVCVVGGPAPVLGEIGVAFVVPSDPDNPPVLADLRSWCQGRLADFKAPDRLQLVRSLPLTSLNKVDRRALRERCQGN